jgi:CopG family nickel-responsive transcriptional regulator
MQRVTRFGVSIPTKLITQFDEIIERERYKNRSKAIAELIRSKVSETEFFKGSHHLVGTITFLYDPSVRSVYGKLQETLRESNASVISNTAVETQNDKMLGVAICAGDWFDIKDTYRKINASKGVLYCNSSFANPFIEE